MKEIGMFHGAWLFIWGLIKNSFVYKILRRIYDRISGAWKRSAIAGWFRTLHINSDALEKSIAGRVIRSPFTFLEFLQRKFGEKLSAGIEGSGLLNMCRAYLNNILALNLRYIGILMLSALVGVMAGQIIKYGSINYILAGAAVVCVLISLINVNITDYLKSSGLVRLVCTLFDVDADFNWYDKEYTQGRMRFVPVIILGVAAGLAGGMINILLTPLAIAGIAAVILVLQKPSAGVFFLVFAAPIVPTMAAVGLSMLCIFSIIIYGITHKGFKWKFDGIGFFILIFLVVYLVAAFTSFAPVKSFSIWAIYVVFIAMYFVIINSVNTEKLLNNLLVVFVLSGFIVCLYGIAQYLFGWDTAQAWMDEGMFEDIKMRIYSTLGNPNVLGEYILLVLPVAIGLMWTRKNPAVKIVYAVVSAIMFVALILTFSRGCWIGLLIAAAIFVTFAAGKLWGLGLAALPIIPMVLPESIINRFMSIGNMDDSSTSYRVYIWMGTLAMMKDFWISGIGMGKEAFTQVYPFYSYNAIVAPHSHNLFLQIMVESGIVGIIVFLLVVFFFLRRMMVGYQIGGKGNGMSTMMTAISAGVCGFLMQGMFDNCFYNYRVLLVFWCVLALGRACVYIAEQRSEGIE